MNSADTKRIVDEIDETRRSEQWRDHDGRPDSRTFRLKSTRRAPPEVLRAQTRLRTAAWRNRQDRLRAPDSHTIGMSLVRALVTARLDEITPEDRGLVGRMLLDLQARGYSLEQAKQTLRRMRTRYVDPADRQGEPDDDCSAPIRLQGEEDNLLF